MWSEWQEYPFCLCLPERQTSLPRWQPLLLHDGTQVHPMESSAPQRHLLELWEVPCGTGRRAFQTLQPQIPHHQYRTWYPAPPEAYQISHKGDKRKKSDSWDHSKNLDIEKLVRRVSTITAQLNLEETKCLFENQLEKYQSLNSLLFPFWLSICNIA